MRFTKTLVLCSASAAILTAASSPAWAQAEPNPPEQAQTNPAPVPQDGANEEEAEVEAVVVTGLRRSLQSAQNIKRNSDQIVDAVVAQDIGKLPDVTASESLARVTGVQVTRAAGEAADVTIRGLPNVATTYNGREIFTAEGRQVAIQDFPAGTVQALEVFKSGTADQVEAGIGGQVNVRSRRPFDFSGREISGAVNAVFFEQSGDNAWNGNILMSDRWETGRGDFGVLVNLAYTSLKFLDSTREQSLDVETSTPTTFAGPAFRFPNSVQMFLGQGRRWRPSANFAAQWRPSEDLQLYADALYQGYRGRDGNVWNYNPLWGGGTRFSNVVLRPGTNFAQSLTATQNGRSDGFKEALNRDTDTYQIGFGGVLTRGDLTFSADVARTKSVVEDDQANVDYAYRGPTTVNAVFSGENGPSFDLPNYNPRDPNNVIYRGLFERRSRSEGGDWQFRADADYDLNNGFLSLIETGVRYTRRDAMRREGSRYSPGESLGIPISALGLEQEVLLGFVFDNDFPFRGVVLPTRDSIFENLPQLRVFAGFPATEVAYPARPQLDAEEKGLAGYAQVRYEFDGAVPIDGVVGLRAVRTETTVAGIQTTSAGTVDIERTAEYTDWLPNVSARMRFRDDLQLRLAFTQTRTRPNFGDLDPSLSISATPIGTDQGKPLRAASGGTVDLEPFRSTNYDASLEWYFSSTGSLTGALFRREVEGFIDRRVVRMDDPTDPNGRIEINLPFNAGSNTLSGFEVSFTSFLELDMLPAWANNFGVQANYTHLQDDGDRKLSNLSENALNLIALYETEMVSARLAYNFRSEFIEFNAGNNGVNNPVTTEDRGQLDFSASYTPFPNITIAFDAINITGEPLRRNRVFDNAGNSYPWNVKYLERVYSLGVRFRR